MAPTGRPPRKILVLGYHGVSRDWDDPLTVTPSALAEGVKALLARGWRGTTFTDAVCGDGTDRALAVTFDDAYRSVIEQAYPVLRSLGVPGTVFVPTAFADRADLLTYGTLARWVDTPWQEELRCMGWDELRELHSAGWEIGSHTETHPRLGRLGDDELVRELQGSKRRCEEEIGVPCTSFAYPYSDLTPRVVDAVGNAGYTIAATVAIVFPRAAKRDYVWPRVGVYRPDSTRRLVVKSLPWVRTARHLLRRARGRE